MNTDVVARQMVDAVRTCESLLSLKDDPYIQKNREQLRTNLHKISQASSGSWLGYHSRVYYEDFRTPTPGHHFSPEWGLMDVSTNPTSGNYQEYAEQQIREAAMTDVDPDFMARLKVISDRAAHIFDEVYDRVRTILDVLLEKEKTSTFERLRDEMKKLSGRIATNKIVREIAPSGGDMSRDMTALTQGVLTPPHCAMQAEQISLFTPFTSLEKLTKVCRSILNYMEVHDMIDQSTASAANKVFIGHGGSPAWRELKDFLRDRLGLSWEEFGREPTAGMSTLERLQAMLDSSCFALLVMTAEDEHVDDSVHARENVIHEAGLFQGRLGFRKAIILLEEGCSEFSNITGLSQIRFPKGKISSAFEDIRRVLEREKIILGQ